MIKDDIKAAMRLGLITVVSTEHDRDESYLLLAIHRLQATYLNNDRTQFCANRPWCVVEVEGSGSRLYKVQKFKNGQWQDTDITLTGTEVRNNIYKYHNTQYDSADN